VKPLSEALTDLGTRVKRLEDSIASMREKNDARLQARREELEAWIDRETNEVKPTTAEGEDGFRSRWSDTKAALERQFEVMRTDFNKRRARLVEKNAEQAALDAERDAVAALTLASRCVDAAEWAVVRAELIRTEVHEGKPRSWARVTRLPRRQCLIGA
jgi:hypothetical protein